MINDRCPAVATILGMAALVLDQAADDLAAGKFETARFISLAGKLDNVASVLRQHGRNATTGHPAVCASPTLR